MREGFPGPIAMTVAAAGVALVLVGLAACGGTEEELPPAATPTPLAADPTPVPGPVGDPRPPEGDARIESISPASGTVGTEIVISGSGFTPENNDVGFTHQGIDFQGSSTAYLNGVSSPDGQTLIFELPEVLGACAFSQMKENEACPAIGLVPPPGDVDVRVVNAKGTSKAVTFEVLEDSSDDGYR